MKKYFLHNSIESSGPFDLEELKAKNITRATPVWHEGLENWKTAGEIPALETIFTVVPPPIKPEPTIYPKTKLEKKRESRKILGLSKTTFYVVFGILLLLVFTTVFNLFQENRSDELEIKNHKTEVGNYQYEQQQKEIEDQKIQLVIQQKIEAERIAAEKKKNFNNRLIEIQSLIETNSNNLEEAKNKLEDTKGFKLLRTATEKNDQISLIQNNIDSYKNEIDKLNKEANVLKLELEKIQ